MLGILMTGRVKVGGWRREFGAGEKERDDCGRHFVVSLVTGIPLRQSLNDTFGQYERYTYISRMRSD